MTSARAQGGEPRRLALAGLLVLGCDAAEPESAPDDVALVEVVWTPAAGATLAYRSRWDWADATRGTAGEWVFETDLGYRVGVELGVIATISIMLVPCSDDESASTEAGLRAHSSVTDSSELLGPWIEAFSAAEPLELGRASASGASYCALHWLAAAQTSSEPALDQASLAVQGWYESPSGERRSFAASVPLAAGGLPELEFDASEREFDASAEHVVTLVRHPTLALDGEPLEELDDLELAYAFVYGLGVTSQVVLEP
jgi:hypothetical protein